MKLHNLPPTLWLLALQPSFSLAYWRMACSVSQTSRVDPIVDPGTVSGHVHKFAGGNNVNENSDFNSLLTSTCSSCEVQKDKSAYWTPQLYYAHANGKFEEVPNYGMTVYYVGRGGTPSNTQPFPAGFKMISGNPLARSYDKESLTHLNTRPVADRVSFRCINEANDIPEEHYMFRTDCVNGMRAQINFQSCWDGVNLYKEDNSHVAYLSGIDYGSCPPSHPVSIPGLFFEVLYFTNMVDQSAGGRFVFSNGDTTGYGFHADFINAWDMDIQQAAVQDCLYTDDGGVISACKHLAPSQDVNFARTCPQQPSVIEEVSRGIIDALPGCNPITSGPEEAPLMAPCPVGSNTPISSSVSSATSSSTSSLSSSSPASSAASSGSSSIPSAITSTSTSHTASTFVTFTTQNTDSGIFPPANGYNASTFHTSSSYYMSYEASQPMSLPNPAVLTTTLQTSSVEAVVTTPRTFISSTGGAIFVTSSAAAPTTLPGIPNATSGTSVATVTGPPAATLITSMVPSTSVIALPNGQTTTITITNYVTVTVTVSYSIPGAFFSVTGPPTSPTNVDRVGAAAGVTGVSADTTITLPGTTLTITGGGMYAPTNPLGPAITTVAPGTTITETTATVSLEGSDVVETTTFINLSGTMYTITGTATTTFFSGVSTLSSDEVTSTTTLFSTTTITVTVTPTSTRTTFPQTALTANTTLTTLATATTGTSAFTSSSLSVDNAFACSLYSGFSIEGCPPPTSTTIDTSAIPRTAFVTVTTLVTDASTGSTSATPTSDATIFTIRGREVSLTRR